MVKLILFFLPSMLFANFAESDVGRNLVALRDKPQRGLVKGEIYQVTQVNNSNHINHTGGGVGVHYTQKDIFWDWLHDYTQNQQYVDTIAFLCGATLFLAFAKGFNTPFPI